jgi:hypothetical protein
MTPVYQTLISQDQSLSHQEPMSQNDSLRLAQEFLGGSGAEPAEIAKLFSESVEWEIAG